MTQPTIKEKMDQVIEVLAGYVTHFEMNERNNAEEYIEKSRDELRDFARLICEEMMKSNCDCHCIFLEDKAQEILKALE